MCPVCKKPCLIQDDGKHYQYSVVDLGTWAMLLVSAEYNHQVSAYHWVWDFSRAIKQPLITPLWRNSALRAKCLAKRLPRKLRLQPQLPIQHHPCGFSICCHLCLGIPQGFRRKCHLEPRSANMTAYRLLPAMDPHHQTSTQILISGLLNSIPIQIVVVNSSTTANMLVVSLNKKFSSSVTYSI